MIVLLVIFLITTIMGAIKIKQTAVIIITTEQASKVVTTTIVAIVMQVEEVLALIALVVLQVALVPQEYHKPILGTAKF
jgi:hypothetical protein